MVDSPLVTHLTYRVGHASCLGGLKTAAEKHERAVQFFKRR